MLNKSTCNGCLWGREEVISQRAEVCFSIYFKLKFGLSMQVKCKKSVLRETKSSVHWSGEKIWADKTSGSAIRRLMLLKWIHQSHINKCTYFQHVFPHMIFLEWDWIHALLVISSHCYVFFQTIQTVYFDLVQNLHTTAAGGKTQLISICFYRFFAHLIQIYFWIETWPSSSVWLIFHITASSKQTEIMWMYLYSTFLV